MMLQLKVENLKMSTRYNVMRKDDIFTGTFSCKDNFGGIVFRKVVKDTQFIGLINIPLSTISTIQVYVHKQLPGYLNSEINSFI